MKFLVKNLGELKNEEEDEESNKFQNVKNTNAVTKTRSITILGIGIAILMAI